MKAMERIFKWSLVLTGMAGIMIFVSKLEF